MPEGSKLFSVSGRKDILPSFISTWIYSAAWKVCNISRKKGTPTLFCNKMGMWISMGLLKMFLAYFVTLCVRYSLYILI